MNEQEELINYFRNIHTRFSRIHVQLLTEARISLPQYVLLSQLASSGIIQMNEASKRLHLSKPAITNLVDRLEQKKFIRRLNHPKDRRISLLEVLPLGKKLVHQFQGRFLDFILSALKKFNHREKGIILRFYSLLLKNMDHLLSTEKK